MNPCGPELYTHVIDSPLGPLSLAVLKRGGVHAIRFGRQSEWPEASRTETNKYACGELALELSQYFAGERRKFSLELLPFGSDFQKAVWQALAKIPWGTIVSYGELASLIGSPKAARAVAGAVAANPLPILIPCHRVILQSGAPGQYASRFVPTAEGIAMKRTLLELEKVQLRWP